MDLRTQLMKSLQDSQAEMVILLNRVDVQREIYPLWTIREILAHLSGWDDSVIAVIQCLQEGSVPTTPAAAGINAYNASTVATREGLDYDHVYREYIETRRTLLDLLAELDEAKLTQVTTLPWGGYGTIEELVHIFAGHELEHAGDVKKLISDAQNQPAC